MHRLPLTISLLAATAVGQDLIFPQGFASAAGPPNDNYPAARAKDANNDGIIQVPGELHAFMTSGFPDANGAMFVRDADVVVEDGEPAFYFGDTETGDIIRGSDDNHNGVLDATEITEYFTFGRRTNGNFLGSPDAVAVWRDPATNQTRVYCNVQQYTTSTLPVQPGIWRFVDLNGDGDAKDAGESSLFVSNSMNLTVPGNSGPVTISADFWDTLQVLPGGKLIAWADGATLTPPYTIQPDMNAFYGFTDNNGTAVPEVFLNLSTLNDLPLHPDFANSTFPNMDIQRAAGERDNYVRFIDVAPPIAPGAPATYYIGSSYNAGYDQNLNGQTISGLVYRVSDIDNDQVIDAGELTLFANFSGVAHAGVAPITFTDQQGVVIATWGQFERPWGMDVSSDGSVSFLMNHANGAVLTMQDQDFSGVIDQGEAVMEYQTGGGTGAFPYPFDTQFGPYWDGFVSLIDGLLPGPFPAGITTIGDGCAAPTRGLVPVMDVWNGAPQVGNTQFQVGAIRTASFAAGILVVDFTAAPAPVPLASIGMPAGCFGYLLNPQSVGFVFADSLGRMPVTVPLPNNPGLAGVTVLFQAAVADSQTTTILPFHSTNALQITIQP